MYFKCTWQDQCEPTYYYLLSSLHCCLTRWWISPLTGASREPCQSLVNFIFVLHMYLTRYSKCSIIFCTITLNKNKPNECTCEKHSSQLSVCKLNQIQRVKKNTQRRRKCLVLRINTQPGECCFRRLGSFKWEIWFLPNELQLRYKDAERWPMSEMSGFLSGHV